MTYEEMVSAVATSIGADRRRAEGAIAAALTTLAERLSPGLAGALAAELPAEVLEWLHVESGPEPLDVDEFLRRIAKREDVDVVTAEHHARAVYAVVRRAVSADTVARMHADLPRDVLTVVAGENVAPAEQLVERVAREAGIGAAVARRLLDAVLETVAERIAPGEVDHVVSRLPVELHPALRAGQAHADPSTRRMDVMTFLRRVAARSELEPSDAVPAMRVVFTTLRDALGVETFSHIAVQLPNDFDLVVPHR
jgi:uncharacterized protein (DUF2267 family)